MHGSNSLAVAWPPPAHHLKPRTHTRSSSQQRRARPNSEKQQQHPHKGMHGAFFSVSESGSSSAHAREKKEGGRREREIATPAGPRLEALAPAVVRARQGKRSRPIRARYRSESGYVLDLKPISSIDWRPARPASRSRHYCLFPRPDPEEGEPGGWDGVGMCHL